MGDLKYQSLGPIRMESVSATTQTPSQNLGERCTFNGEEYVYCYNAGGATITKGNVVKFITGASGYSVAATSLTDVFSPAVGVAKHSAAIAGDYFWALTRGFASVVPTSALTFDYVNLAAGAAGQVVQWAATGPTQGIAIGYALGVNTGAAGTIYAFIKTGV